MNSSERLVTQVTKNKSAKTEMKEVRKKKKKKKKKKNSYKTINFGPSKGPSFVVDITYTMQGSLLPNIH